MDWLTSVPTWALVLVWLLISLLVAAGGRVVVRLVVAAHEQVNIPSVTAPLMPALGATFAVLMALTLSSEAGYLRSAQDIVSNEAAAASRLAWSATGPGIDGEPIQAALLTYLETTRRNEWEGDAAASGDDPETEQAIATLERAVRAQAAVAAIGTPASTELLASLDAVTSGRRMRIAAADRQLPAIYVITLIASGFALLVNAGAIVASAGRRAALLIVGLAGVVGLSLALLFALSAPWRGALEVSGDAIDHVVTDLERGFFTP